MYTITQIEDAIIATLQASVMGGYCKKIASFQIEAGDLGEQIRLFALQMPCALVMLTSGTFDYSLSGMQDMPLEFTVLVCAESFRGKGDARRNSVGAYQMLDDLRSSLTGSRCGLNIEELLPQRIAAEINTDVLSAYSMSFTTKARYAL
jgi:hypothetical protein